jgi:hypothetical protein
VLVVRPHRPRTATTDLSHPRRPRRRARPGHPALPRRTTAVGNLRGLPAATGTAVTTPWMSAPGGGCAEVARHHTRWIQSAPARNSRKVLDRTANQPTRSGEDGVATDLGGIAECTCVAGSRLCGQSVTSLRTTPLPSSTRATPGLPSTWKPSTHHRSCAPRRTTSTPSSRLTSSPTSSTTSPGLRAESRTDHYPDHYPVSDLDAMAGAKPPTRVVIRDHSTASWDRCQPQQPSSTSTPDVGALAPRRKAAAHRRHVGRNSDGRNGIRTGNTGHQRSLTVNNGHSKTRPDQGCNALTRAGEDRCKVVRFPPSSTTPENRHLTGLLHQVQGGWNP